MAAGKPLTKFLITLVHSSELMARFNSSEREALLREWGLADHELFSKGELTLERVQEAVAAEHREEGAAVEVAWWIWFFGPPPKPDWVWGLDDEGSDDDHGGGGGGHATVQ